MSRLQRVGCVTACLVVQYASIVACGASRLADERQLKHEAPTGLILGASVAQSIEYIYIRIRLGMPRQWQQIQILVSTLVFLQIPLLPINPRWNFPLLEIPPPRAKKVRIGFNCYTAFFPPSHIDEIAQPSSYAPDPTQKCRLTLLRWPYVAPNKLNFCCCAY